MVYNTFVVRFLPDTSHRTEILRLSPLASLEPFVRHKVKHIHFVGGGGDAMSREQGPVAFGVTGCDRPRLAPAADGIASTVDGPR